VNYIAFVVFKNDCPKTFVRREKKY